MSGWKMPTHSDGTRDTRYSVSHEYTGHPNGPVYVARFCGTFLAAHPSRTAAARSCRDHAQARRAFLFTYGPADDYGS
jgi:hypothetical protein